MLVKHLCGAPSAPIQQTNTHPTRLMSDPMKTSALLEVPEEILLCAHLPAERLLGAQSFPTQTMTSSVNAACSGLVQTAGTPLRS